MSAIQDKTVQIPNSITVSELGRVLDTSPIEIIKELMKKGIMAAVNQSVDYDTAALVAQEFGFEPKPLSTTPTKKRVSEPEAREDAEALQHRPPVVTIMGHVDHGKTSLLDVIRQTNVAAGEVGGITQHIGAYQVEVDGRRITFVDTPGHEAFTAMRARGAQVTDIAVLVVAADDGIMPQTVEAIDHAKAAGVPIIVAINKIDLPDANPDKVKQQLTEHGLVIEEWGGDVISVPVSAKTKQGIEDLLENILLLADVYEFKANPNCPAQGAVIEAEMDNTRGPIATVLVQTGTLHVGNVIVAGETWGKVKAMFNEHGQRVKSAGPSTPVKIMGLQSVPTAGDIFQVVSDERQARAAAEERQRSRQIQPAPVSLDTLSSEISVGKVRDLNVVLKADVQGSVDAVSSSLERLSNEQVKVRIIHAATGNITDSDVMLAAASDAIIIGFNTRPDASTRRLADMEKVEIRLYSIIYQLIEDVEKAIQGLLEPTYSEVVEGRAEVRQVFRTSAGRVAGCYVRDGTMRRGATTRVVRDGDIIHSSRISSLRRFKEDVREVAAGYECGMSIEGFDAFQEGDIIEAYGQQRQS